MFECKNCGANELENGRCAYCKTVYKVVKDPVIPSILPETVKESSLGYEIMVAIYVIVIMVLVFGILIP